MHSGGDNAVPCRASITTIEKSCVLYVLGSGFYKHIKVRTRATARRVRAPWLLLSQIAPFHISRIISVVVVAVAAYTHTVRERPKSLFFFSSSFRPLCPPTSSSLGTSHLHLLHLHIDTVIDRCISMRLFFT